MELAAEPDAVRYHGELSSAIRDNPAAEGFTDTPLMLTVLAVVHWSQKRLPEQRVELYEAAVEYLLDSRKEMASFPTPLRREALQAVALAMFEHDEGVQRTLGRRGGGDARWRAHRCGCGRGARVHRERGAAEQYPRQPQ